MRVAARDGHRVAVQRKLADVEVLELESAVKRFLGLQCDGGDVAALDLRAAVEYGARAIVVAHGQADLQCHLALPGSAAAYATHCMREPQHVDRRAAPMLGNT